MWCIWVLLCLTFLQGSRYGSSYITTYYRRKTESGYFAVHLAIVTTPSGIQCAGACSNIGGCSVASFSTNQKLCKLSAGTGVYISDSNWTSVLLRTYGPEITDRTATVRSLTTTPDPVTSYPTSITTTTAETVTSYPTSTTTTTAETVTSHLNDFTTTTSGPTQHSTNRVTKSEETETVLSTALSEATTTVPNPNLRSRGSTVSCPRGFTATSSGSCFHLAVRIRSYSKSVTACENNNGYLATITSSAENGDLIAILQQRKGELSKDILMGGSDSAEEGIWRWPTDDRFNWISGGPTNSDPDADCLAFSFSNAWQWKDVICSGTYHSVCETAPL